LYPPPVTAVTIMYEPFNIGSNANPEQLYF
jgi:hypothetical protein